MIGPKQSKRQVNVDKDESGIYKARTNNRHHAHTVADDRNMYVDMPADYKKPNQVIHVNVILLVFILFSIIIWFFNLFYSIN